MAQAFTFQLGKTLFIAVTLKQAKKIILVLAAVIESDGRAPGSAASIPAGKYVDMPQAQVFTASGAIVLKVIFSFDSPQVRDNII